MLAVLPLGLLAGAAAAAPPPRAPDAPELRQQLRACLSAGTEQEERLRACRRAAALGPHNEWSVAIRLVLAQRLAELSRWDETISVYRALSDERPAEAEWLLRLGAALLFGAGRPDAAEAPLREALLRDTRSAEAWSLLGVSLNARGRYPEAVTALEKAQALDADYVAARPALSQALEASRQGQVWPPPS